MAGDPGLQVEQDVRFEAGEWRASQVTWVVVLSLMAATLLGVFGNGPLSTARKATGGFAIEYQRFGRFGAPTRLVVHAPADTDGRIRLSVDQALLEGFHIERISPEPTDARLLAEGVEYTFATGPGGGTVRLDLQPAQRWLVRSSIAGRDGRMQFWQFVYP